MIIPVIIFAILCLDEFSDIFDSKLQVIDVSIFLHVRKPQAVFAR